MALTTVRDLQARGSAVEALAQQTKRATGSMARGLWLLAVTMSNHVARVPSRAFTHKTLKQGMEAGKGSAESTATRFLVLWARKHQGLCTDQELGELFGLLQSHLLRSSAVRALPAHERDDVLMSYLEEKILCDSGAARAPVNLYEFARYISNFVEDRRRKQPPAKTMPPEDILDLLDGDVHSPGATCSLDEFAGRRAAADQTTSAQRWIDGLVPEERSLLLSVLCLGETATTALEKLGMLGATHRIKKLGLILTNVHADGHWSRSSWFKHTKLGQLFKSLDINGDRDTLADARQVLSLLCRLLGVDGRKEGRAR